MSARATTHFEESAVLEVLRRSGRGRVWSSIAAEIKGVDRKEIRMADVRGIRDVCAALEARGLAKKVGGGTYRATEGETG